MDSKYVRTTVDNLLAELERNPAIGRRPSPSFMNRYGRPLGLGIALGVSGAAGCSGSSEESKGNPDALPFARDAYGVPDVYRADAAPADRPVDRQADTYPFGGPVDAYGMTMPDRPADLRFLDGPVDLYGISSDGRLDTRDALPPNWDLYAAPPWDTSRDTDGTMADTMDTRPLIGDGYGDLYGISNPDRPADTRDALPLFGDAYGMTNPDRPVDGPAAPDAGTDTE